jgi:NtrC-family two-component system response regulator AlgB
LLRCFTLHGGTKVTGFTEAARLLLQRYPWPGNLRELRNAVERGVILAAGSSIDVSDLPAQFTSGAQAGPEVGGRVTLKQLEAEHIRRVLASTSTLEEAAAVLGINVSTLYRNRKRLAR